MTAARQILDEIRRAPATDRHWILESLLRDWVHAPTPQPPINFVESTDDTNAELSEERVKKIQHRLANPDQSKSLQDFIDRL